jgi:hypothetical protein
LVELHRIFNARCNSPARECKAHHGPMTSTTRKPRSVSLSAG